jgi:hypothetical protein
MLSFKKLVAAEDKSLLRGTFSVTLLAACWQKEMSMLTRGVSTATLVGVPLLDPGSLPLLVAAVLLIVAFLALILLALRKKDHVQAGRRVRPWSISFFLEARNGHRKLPWDSENEHASKADRPASKS